MLSSREDPRAARLGLPVAVGGLALGAAALIAVHLLLRATYWDYSEGVYALTAHNMLHGQALYTGMAGAQPPGVFVAGLVLLAIHDSLEWLRFGVGCLQLLAGLVAGRMVYEITASRAAAILAPAGMLLTPWAVHEHGALTPELVALPVLLGAAWLTADDRVAAAGVLCGLLPLIKLPFAIPALVLVLCSADRWRAVRWALGTVLVGLGATTALAGASFWRETVVAQTQTGSRALSMLAGFWAQSAWNVLGLLVPAGVAILFWRRAVNRRMLAVAAALAGAMIVTFLTNFKQGTGLNITVPVEAALVPLAASGTALALTVPAARRTALLCILGLLFTLAQSMSLIAAPHHSVPFLRAGSRPAWAILMTGPQVRAAVARARSCGPGVAYSGPPLLALLADRSMPGGQPDQFITTHSRVLAPYARRITAAHHVCPWPPPSA